MKKTLVLLAAGIGSRFGGGIKQLEPVGPHGEIIMDYSIHDAVKAGFNNIVFIIRKDIEKDFREIIGDRIEMSYASLGVKFNYAFQSMDNIPATYREGRAKPWGTAHAVLCCRGIVDGPFSVINADDYYGADAFVKASDFLETGGYGLVSYVLRNTLSENGGVSRGICNVDNDILVDVVETRNIIPDGSEASSEGVMIPADSPVSMNFWCLPASFIEFLQDSLPEFLAGLENPLKDEYMLPTMVSKRIALGDKVTVLRTDSRWFGVTYREDKPSVVASFRKLYDDGVYQDDLTSDLR